MKYRSSKAERDAIARLLLHATHPDILVGWGLKPFGEEFDAAMKLLHAMKEVREFDPDVDDLSAARKDI